ncbi:MAG: SMC-Scp complex subunit ScpB [Anaerolineaceae bacterium]|jgi:segregation and condensation protein B|nr:SMC-Scp complex subunit ScpB [Anaerolineaceae bacterium]
MIENNDSQTNSNLVSGIEAILFISGSPVQISHLADTFDVSSKDIEANLEVLEQDLIHGRGIRLLRYSGKVQLTSSPEHSDLIEKYLGIETTSRLSRAALETLAIIAYRQPITRPGIDAIRGVNSDGVLKSLLSKGLIEEIGRTEGPGRPILYGITEEFLQYFGLGSINELPELFNENLIVTENNNGLLKD